MIDQYLDKDRKLDRELQPPPEMEAFVMAAFDRFQRRRKVSQWCAFMALAASLGCLAFLGYSGRARVVQTQSAQPRMQIAETKPPAPVMKMALVKRHRNRARVEPGNLQPAFEPIPFTRPLNPSERASIVRMEMPVSQLIAAGLPFFASDMGARAQADVVVGEDGLARAVRVISISGY